MKHYITRFEFAMEEYWDNILNRRNEPGFRYCVEAVDYPRSFEQSPAVGELLVNSYERLAIVEYPVRLYGDATIPPPPRHLVYCDNTPQNREDMEVIADTLNSEILDLEARLRGVLSSGADANDNEAAKQKGKVRE